MIHPAPPRRPKAPRRRRPSSVAWVLIAVAVVLGSIAVASGGFAALLLMAALLGSVTAVYALATGDRSWARLPSRRTAAIVLAVCLVATVAGFSAIASSRSGQTIDAASAARPAAPTTSPRTPTPRADASVRFTEEAPEDPPVATKPASEPAVVAPDERATDRAALDVLATLPVKGKAPKTGYDRTGDFGTAWLDVDRNGCDTRNDILARDLTAIVRSGPCTVLRGTLAEPYTGATISFVRGDHTSALVQIDHVVALSNAWQTGAQQLTPTQRMSLANDPLNLLAADGRSNAQKGDGDAATWLPKAKSFRCAYVARQVSVKATYGLWVAPAEHDAMARILSSCPAERALTSPFTPTAPVVPDPGPTPVPSATAAPAPAAPAPAAPAPAAPAPAAPAPAAPAPAPAPPAPAPESPAPAPAPAPNVVHPGAFCAPAGATGVTSSGTAMICGTTANSPDRARWHQA